MSKLTFPYDNKNEFAGIFNYLRTYFGDDFSREVEITASCRVNDLNTPSNITLYEDPHKFFLSDNYSNSWIRFDFKEYRIIPTDYTIRTLKDWGPNSVHLRGWIIEVSNDSANWLVIAEEHNCSFLNGPGFVHTFTVEPLNKSYRFLRIRQNSINWNNSYHLGIESFEVYGTLLK